MERTPSFFWRVFSSGFRLFLERPGLYAVIGLIFAAPGALLQALGAPEIWGVLAGLATSAAMAPITIYAVMLGLRGEATDLMDAFRQGGQRFLAALGAIGAICVATILFMLPVILATFGVAMSLGPTAANLVAFVAGGAVVLVVMIRYYVAVTAAVVENLSPLACLGRSVSLTEGRRLPLLGALVLLTMALGAPVALLRFGEPAEAAHQPGGFDVLGLIESLYGAGVAGPIGVIASAYAFFLLRQEKEDLGP